MEQTVSVWLGFVDGGWGGGGLCSAANGGGGGDGSTISPLGLSREVEPFQGDTETQQIRQSKGLGRLGLA